MKKYLFPFLFFVFAALGAGAQVNNTEPADPKPGPQEAWQQLVRPNYHRWNICQDAIHLGTERGIRLYQFLREPLTRRFGEAWYNQLCTTADELLKQGLI